MREIDQYVNFKIFKSSFISWERLFAEAATFAESIIPEQLICISHSSDHSEGVVTVWYWSAEPREAALERQTGAVSANRS